MAVGLYDPALGRFLEVDPVEGGSANDYDYVAGDPVNGYDLDGMLSDNCAGSKNYAQCQKDRAAHTQASKGALSSALKSVTKVAGTVATVTGRAAVVVGAGALIVTVTVGTGGVAPTLIGISMGLGAASAAASGAQMGAGMATHNRGAAVTGGIGFGLGLLTLGTWGAVSGPAANLWAASSRQGIYETANHVCRSRSC